MLFSFLSMLVAVPSAVKVFNWTATLYKGTIFLKTPMLYALGFIGLFTIGGLTGICLATLGFDMHVHDTYFIVAHFHYIMVGGDGDGVSGRTAFLVAEDDRADLFGVVGPRQCAGRVHRFQSGVFSAVHSRLPGQPASISRLSRTSFRCST